MSEKVVVVDYGIGNVFSVCNALRRIGTEPNLTSETNVIRGADRLILPGVGAFASAMNQLRARGIIPALNDFVSTGRPFLGICIGMQVLMDRSTEFGNHEGLGFIPGKVDRIPSTAPSGIRLRVPHIGWAQLRADNDDTSAWKGTPLEGTIPGADAVYFVHSYHCLPNDPKSRIAFADYDGSEVTAAVRRDNIVGIQFHPERSAEAGQKILKAFLAL